MIFWRCIIKQAVILAGGMGTRLASVVSEVPKPMAPIQNKPFLDYLIDLLKQNGFDSFVFLLGYKADIIENYYKNLKNAVFIKEEYPRGTGGALLNAYEYFKNEFFVVNGDTFFDIDFSLINEFSKDKPCTIALRYTDNLSRYGVVEIDDEYEIKTFCEKQSISKEKIDGQI